MPRLSLNGERLGLRGRTDGADTGPLLGGYALPLSQTERAERGRLPASCRSWDQPTGTTPPGSWSCPEPGHEDAGAVRRRDSEGGPVPARQELPRLDAGDAGLWVSSLWGAKLEHATIRSDVQNARAYYKHLHGVDRRDSMPKLMIRALYV